MATTKYPSRIRYEESHPSVTFRVSKEDYKRLDRIRKKWGMSFREMIMHGVGLIEKDMETEKKRINEATKRAYEEVWAEAQREALMGVEIGRCPWCGVTFEWDLTDPEIIAQLEDAISSRNMHHDTCIEERKRLGR